MRSFFTGVVGYVFLVLFLALGGAVFCYTTLYSGSAEVTPFFTYMLLASGILLPILTMKSFSEERKIKTEQLLLTAPVSITGMVMGKFLAAYILFAACIVFNSLYFLLLIPYTVLQYVLLLGNIFAILLVGMVFISIGLFISSLTENQLAAAIGTIAVILAFLLVGVLAALLPTTYWLRYVLDFLSVFTRFQGFSNGYFDFASVFYYLSMSAVFLYLTVRIYDRRRYN